MLYISNSCNLGGVLHDSGAVQGTLVEKEFIKAALIMAFPHIIFYVTMQGISEINVPHVEFQQMRNITG